MVYSILVRMRVSSNLLFIAVCSYCAIMLNGEMISIQMFCYLGYGWLVADDNVDRLFIILALIGFALLFMRTRNNPGKTFIKHVIVFFLLLSPLINRMIAVPLSLFNYPLFIPPTAIFIVFYLLLLLFLRMEMKGMIIKIGNLP